MAGLGRAVFRARWAGAGPGAHRLVSSPTFTLSWSGPLGSGGVSRAPTDGLGVGDEMLAGNLSALVE